jgi:mRNA interferase RelE/StbE
MTISFHPDVLKQLQRLPRAEFETALQVIIGLSHEPRPVYSKKLVGSQSDWRVRFGQFRVVCTIDDAAGEVMVFNAAKRSDAYR